MPTKLPVEGLFAPLKQVYFYVQIGLYAKVSFVETGFFRRDSSIFCINILVSVPYVQKSLFFVGAHDNAIACWDTLRSPLANLLCVQIGLYVKASSVKTGFVERYLYFTGVFPRDSFLFPSREKYSQKSTFSRKETHLYDRDLSVPKKRRARGEQRVLCRDGILSGRQLYVWSVFSWSAWRTKMTCTKVTCTKMTWRTKQLVECLLVLYARLDTYHVYLSRTFDTHYPISIMCIYLALETR